MIREILRYSLPRHGEKGRERSPAPLLTLLRRDALALLAGLNLNLPRLHLLRHRNLDVQHSIVQTAVQLLDIQAAASVTAAWNLP